MKRLLAFASLGFLALSCTALPELPLEHQDLGSYAVTSFLLPHDQRAAMSSAQRMVGKTFVFGPDRVLFPTEFGHPDCQHEGYRLTQRSTQYLPPFDLGEAGSFSVVDAGIEDRELLELWNSCLSGVYLSVDRGRMYIPGRGALLILDRQ
jgi:hypothetical protein